MQPSDSHESEANLWKFCSLRRWLNEAFINDAFTSEEQSVILNVTVPAAPDSETKLSENNTVDKVFLLSENEIEEYFASLGQKRDCLATDYAYNKSPYETSEGDCLWWIRDTSGYGSNATRNCWGEYVFDYIDTDHVRGVRPVMWISQSKL